MKMRITGSVFQLCTKHLPSKSLHFKRCMPNVPINIPVVHFKSLQVETCAYQLDTRKYPIQEKGSVRIQLSTSNIQTEK